MAFPEELNPFHGIINFEEKRPHRYTITSHFITKIIDAFDFISGRIYGNEFNFGLYGWLTLFIPTVLEYASYVIAGTSIKMFSKLGNSSLVSLFTASPFLAVGILGVGSIYLALIGSRFLISGILTAISMPIIAMVAGISGLVKRHYEKKLLSLEVKVLYFNNTPYTQSLESLLAGKKLTESLEFLEIENDNYKFTLMPNTGRSIILNPNNDSILIEAIENLFVCPTSPKT